MIPPDASAAFVANMEDVLEVYQRPHDPQRPLVCLDETSKQLMVETRAPIPAKQGRKAGRLLASLRSQHPAQMCLARDNAVVHTFTPDRADLQAYCTGLTLADALKLSKHVTSGVNFT